MVQIIQPNIPVSTIRQQALDQALGNILSGLQGMEETKRQQALRAEQQAIRADEKAREKTRQDEALKLKFLEMGVNPEDALSEFRTGRKILSPAIPAQEAVYGEELQGPVMPGQAPLRQLLSQAVPAKEAILGVFEPYFKRKLTEQELKAEDLKTTRLLREGQLQQLAQKGELIPFEKMRMEADIERKKALAEQVGSDIEYKRSLMAQKESLIPLQKDILSAKLAKEKELLPFEKRKIEAEIKQREAIARKSAKSGAVAKRELSVRERLAKASGDTQGKIGAIASGIKAIGEMTGLVSKGEGPEYITSSTPLIGKYISSTPFSQSQEILNEVVGRLQSGGAIGVEEGERFKSMGPRPGDNPAIQKKKLEDQKSFLLNKLTGFGFKEQDLMDLGFDIGKKSITPRQQTPTKETPAIPPWEKHKQKRNPGSVVEEAFYTPEQFYKDAFYDKPRTTYVEDPEVINAANSYFHSAGNLQRLTQKQLMDLSQAEQTAREEELYRQKREEELRRRGLK